MTVEVDPAQVVVDRGPYRFVRHPSYVGLLLLPIGLAVIEGDGLSLAVGVLLPSAVVCWRIHVEENELLQVLGEPYRAYVRRSHRLIPGVW